MKKMTLFILLAAQFFIGEIKTSEIVISNPIVVSTTGPVVEFCNQHKFAIGTIAATYFIVYIIHNALNRVPAEEVTHEVYEALLHKIKHGDATIKDVIRFFRLFIFPGSKEDVVDRTTIVTNIDGSKVEITDKFPRRVGTGWAAWFKFRILDNLEKITKPVLALCGALWIVNNALKDGTIPGNSK